MLFVRSALLAASVVEILSTPTDDFLSQRPPAWPLPLGMNALQDVTFPDRWPWSKHDLSREDESDDQLFYSQPRLVAHIDQHAIAGLTDWYAANLPQGDDVAIFDFCSSWISHFPTGLKAQRVVGLGMNPNELAKNTQLTETVHKDLNKDPIFPFADQSFDAIVNAVSVDYLNKPLQLFKEIRRIARPGALVAMSFSNRMFFTKAIKRWTQATEFQRLMICGSYFYFSGFRNIKAERIDNGKGNPMWVVYAHAPTQSASAAAEL
eukprot:TRINITY_DN57850_c0_g1_i1.p1 TRINITY_DN57850_c0_g1~~TRINITY_DN57850_c0_g1_i1.p1  ORF type:complete len:289 (-),score=3.18 TRINITY_DN57850_c0_g1_i1:197-988(-)